MYKFNISLIGGVFFLILQIFIVIINLNSTNLSFYYWFCNHIPILFSILFFMKKIQYIKALISVGLIPQILWILDLTLNLFFGFILFGFTQYFFEIESIFRMISILFIHIFSTLIALILTINYETKPKSLVISFIYLILLFIVTITFTQSTENTNCVFEICGLEDISIPFYEFLWPILTFIVMIIPSYYIQIYIKKIFSKVYK